MRRASRITSIALSGLLLSLLIASVWLTHRATTLLEPDPRPLVPKTTAPAPAARAPEPGPLDDGGLSLAREFTPPIHDATSLSELREAIRIRGPLGLAVLEAEFGAVRLGPRPGRAEVTGAADLLTRIGLLQMYLGRDDEAAGSFRKALALGRPRDLDPGDRARLMGLLGLVTLHQTEAAPRGDGRSSTGIQDAVARFNEALRESPGDPSVRWLLELARSRLVTPPEQVPGRQRGEPKELAARVDGAPFEDVSAAAGLHVRGPSLAGGTCFDDFDGDGRPDLLITSLDSERGASLFLNNGDGTFRDVSSQAGLDDQVFAAGAAHADYDNDGDLDVVLLRGEGEEPMRLSLLRNSGKGVFEDVTLAAGLGEPTAASAAAWGDYDADGRLDLFVCGECRHEAADPNDDKAARRNLCRLYRNQGDGTFRDVAATAGVENRRRARGAAWDDIDDDGRPDLLVTNADGPPRLYRNLGDGTFRDLAPTLGLGTIATGRHCWFWDDDRDGQLDLFMTGDRNRPDEYLAEVLGSPIKGDSHPRLLRNAGEAGFQDASLAVGLHRPIPTLGAAFGDVDNDGDLDLCLGRGWAGFSSVVPPLLLRNEGERGFTHLPLVTSVDVFRGGSSLALADVDGDGDLDLFVHGGGMVPGLRAQHAFLRNRGGGGHWLRLRLVGNRSNRSAIGARIRVELENEGGRKRPILRSVASSSSAGGSSLVQTVGLGPATRVSQVAVQWPAGGEPQILRDLAAGQEIILIEGQARPEVATRPTRGD